MQPAASAATLPVLTPPLPRPTPSTRNLLLILTRSLSTARKRCLQLRNAASASSWRKTLPLCRLRVLYYLLFVIGLLSPLSFYIVNSSANESITGHLRVAGSQERCPAGTELMLGSPNAATRLTMRDWRTLWRDSCKRVGIDGLTARRWEKHIRLRLHGVWLLGGSGNG